MNVMWRHYCVLVWGGVNDCFDHCHLFVCRHTVPAPVLCLCCEQYCQSICVARCSIGSCSLSVEKQPRSHHAALTLSTYTTCTEVPANVSLCILLPYFVIYKTSRNICSSPWILLLFLLALKSVVARTLKPTIYAVKRSKCADMFKIWCHLM